MNFKEKLFDNARILAVAGVLSLGGLYVANAFIEPALPPADYNSITPYTTIAGLSSVPKLIGAQQNNGQCATDYGPSARVCQLNDATDTTQYRDALAALGEGWVVKDQFSEAIFRSNAGGNLADYKTSFKRPSVEIDMYQIENPQNVFAFIPANSIRVQKTIQYYTTTGLKNAGTKQCNVPYGQPAACTPTGFTTETLKLPAACCYY